MDTNLNCSHLTVGKTAPAESILYSMAIQALHGTSYSSISADTCGYAQSSYMNVLGNCAGSGKG